MSVATPRIIARAISKKLERRLELADSQEDPFRRGILTQKAWEEHAGRSTRYAATATLSQQKRRTLNRRRYPHGWKGGVK
mgnify:CR=1 FL=1